MGFFKDAVYLVAISMFSKKTTDKLLGFSQVDSVPDLADHIHRTTARSLLHING